MSMAAAAFVLDRSVALGAFFEDEQDDYSLAVWRSLAEARAVVPALWHVELGHILSRALRAGRITAQALDGSWQQLDVVGLHTLAPHGDARHWAQRAADWSLSAYDACYLDTALQQRLPLATKDGALLDAARRAGVSLYLPARGVKAVRKSASEPVRKPDPEKRR
ncbi:MAG: type II toxin-antitoxin system VapC family toxin [Proteobacteria bacterium]|nr:type II toxin-antitoxin system VapC family toxin [Pseudomonadota bacterium]